MISFDCDRHIATLADALDVIADARHLHDADWVAVDVEQLPDDFFELRSGVAGELTQKFAQYAMSLAVVGDISAVEATSTAVRDWVRESNRGRTLWFVPDRAALAARLG